MIKCPNCSSTELVLSAAFDDGDDHIDAEVDCLACGEGHWVTISPEQLEMLEEGRNDE